MGKTTSVKLRKKTPNHKIWEQNIGYICFFKKNFQEILEHFNMTIMERKRKTQYSPFSKIDDEDVWNIMGDNILQHALLKM